MSAGKQNCSEHVPFLELTLSYRLCGQRGCEATSDPQAIGPLKNVNEPVKAIAALAPSRFRRSIAPGASLSTPDLVANAHKLRYLAPVKFELDRHPFFWLTQVIGARDRELAQGLREHGLRVPEWRVLAALFARRLCTTTELAELATIDRTTLTRTLDRMADAGWLERRPDEDDMRVTRLALTAGGKRMFDRMWPEVEELNALALEGLSKTEIEQLRGILSRMHANLEAYVSGEEVHAG